MNKINTKTDDLQIKIRLENEISLGVQTHAIDFLILNLELIILV